MNKFNFAGVAVVGALPGAFLCFLLVQVFMNHASKASSVMLAVAGLTLIAAATVALMPLLILMFNPGMPSAPKEAKPRTAKEKPAPTKKGKGKKGEEATLMAADDYMSDDLEPTIDDIGSESEGFVSVDMGDDEDNLDDFVDIGEYDDEDEFK